MNDVIDIPENKIGVVTTKEGMPLPTGEIAGGEIDGHNVGRWRRRQPPVALDRAITFAPSGKVVVSAWPVYEREEL